jgi:hypothetical protein
MASTAIITAPFPYERSRRLPTPVIHDQHSLTATLRRSAELNGDAGVLSMVIPPIGEKFWEKVPGAHKDVTILALIRAYFPLHKSAENNSLLIESRITSASARNFLTNGNRPRATPPGITRAGEFSATYFPTDTRS